MFDLRYGKGPAEATQQASSPGDWTRSFSSWFVGFSSTHYLREEGTSQLGVTSQIKKDGTAMHDHGFRGGKLRHKSPEVPVVSGGL